ncbi:MAG: adenylate/guanylate cyclase domain-containing protein [Oscillatoriales cyanobacterium RM2_1_1]|nr:adenylate/guanylate cyclase domain-containing protein [Oscillatoriales cyanobacterium SM2_3_0]NJO46590.1 adenylate/guanylate cyclase domain-containing protein [Oscillatoriales cyanobacterium RM2_1_1]
MRSHLQLLLRAFSARLSQRIVLWIFASIILIEFLILIPSVYRRRQELLEQSSEATASKIAWIIETYPQQSEAELLRQLENLKQLNPMILGGALYRKSTGELIHSFGELPQLSPSQGMQTPTRYFRNPRGDRYDAACLVAQIKNTYTLIVRYDAEEINQEVRQFILRIAGLVLIISVFVTGGSMLVLERLIITPILNLRSDLIKAGDAISQSQSPPQFYSTTVSRRDEFGEVITAFIQIFDDINQAVREQQKAEAALRLEKEKSEQLLLNILPQPIAEQLKQDQGSIADGFEQATILFADIGDFTGLASAMSPTELVNLLNEIFSCFDRLVDQYNLEKIKTIGDAYMVVGGIPIPRADHAEAIAEVALKMQQAIKQFYRADNKAFDIRIGINTGPVVAGVIGLKKFTYDLWGNAVNVASRMESQGVLGKIQVSETTYQLLKDQYHFEKRGLLKVKGKGLMDTYFLQGQKDTSFLSR